MNQPALMSPNDVLIEVSVISNSDASSLQTISQGRFFIPVKDAQRWFHPQSKHYGCNPTGHGEKESSSVFCFPSTVSGSKHSIKT